MRNNTNLTILNGSKMKKNKELSTKLKYSYQQHDTRLNAVNNSKKKIFL